MRQGNRVSVYEVAKRAGISIATVSRVLNQPHVVSAKTREKVLAAVKELNYVPDSHAAARARTSHIRVAVVGPARTFPGFTVRLDGALRVLTQADADVIVVRVDDEKLRQNDKYIDSIVATGRYDALIIMLLSLESQDLSRLVETDFPTVLVETVHPKFPTIGPNHERGSYLATKHLIDKGYKKIGFVGYLNEFNFAFDISSRRENGFRQAMDEHNLKVEDGWVMKSNYGILCAAKRTSEFLTTHNRAQALVCASDTLALGALKTCKELGLSVPEDIAIIGFDDIEMASYLGLSTVRQPIRETGVQAAERVQYLLKKANITRRDASLELEVIARSTT